MIRARRRRELRESTDFFVSSLAPSYPNWCKFFDMTYARASFPSRKATLTTMFRIRKLLNAQGVSLVVRPYNNIHNSIYFKFKLQGYRFKTRKIYEQLNLKRILSGYHDS